MLIAIILDAIELPADFSAYELIRDGTRTHARIITSTHNMRIIRCIILIQEASWRQSHSLGAITAKAKARMPSFIYDKSTAMMQDARCKTSGPDAISM